MSLSHHLLRRTTATLRPTQHVTRRSYASAAVHGGQHTSSIPWAIGSIAVLASGLYFLQGTRPHKASHANDEHHITAKPNIQVATGSSTVPENHGRTTVEVDRGRADNPYVNEPGKSMKGEGETETARLKGSIQVQRPQA